jgi:hypothetical protein
LTDEGFWIYCNAFNNQYDFNGMWMRTASDSWENYAVDEYRHIAALFVMF